VYYRTDDSQRCEEIDDFNDNSLSSNASDSDINDENMSHNNDFINDDIYVQVNDNTGSCSSNSVGSSLCNDLRDLLIQYAISRNFTDALLKLLKKHNIDVPLSSKTLFNTSKKTIETFIVEPGTYYHCGLAEGLICSINEYYPSHNLPLRIKINFTLI